MTHFFPNLRLPKLAAKSISDDLGLPLSTTQKGIAVACGFQDWHDMANNHMRSQECRLDRDLCRAEYIERQARTVVDLANALDVALGDAQHALAISRLFGSSTVLLRDQVDIRLRCLRLTSMPPMGRRLAGAVGKLRSPGRSGEVVILREYGRPTSVITQKNIGTVGDFEYVSPRFGAEFFLPYRLYLPYGIWRLSDGSRVLFSRDYAPLWLLREGERPVRIEPWKHIDWQERHYLWGDHRTPWGSQALCSELFALLEEAGIRTLPILADGLPLLLNPEATSMADAAHLLQLQRSASKSLH